MLKTASFNEGNEINNQTISWFLLLMFFSVAASYSLDFFVQMRIDSFFIVYFSNMFFIFLPAILGIFYSPKTSGIIGFVFGMILNLSYSFLYGIGVAEFFSLFKVLNVFITIWSVSFIFHYLLKSSFSFWRIMISFFIGLLLELDILLTSIFAGVPMEYLNITDRISALFLVAILYSIIVKTIFKSRYAFYFFKMLN